MALPERLVRGFSKINEIPSATTSKNFSVVYMDLYFCLRKRGPEATVLSRIYDRTQAYYKVQGFTGAKDPKNPTTSEIEKLSILETMPKDGSGNCGWVQFKDEYWLKHIPLTSDQISRAVLSLADMGLIEIENSRGTEKALKGIRLVRINGDVFDRAVFECIETTTSAQSTWGSNRGTYVREKQDSRHFDFWTWIKSHRHVEIFADRSLPKDLDPLPDHVPKLRKAKNSKHVTAKHGDGDERAEEHDTAKHGNGENMIPQNTVTVDMGGNGDITSLKMKTTIPQNTVHDTAKHGTGIPQNTVTENRKTRYGYTAKHGNKEYSYEQNEEQNEEQDVGYAPQAGRLTTKQEQTSSLDSGEHKQEPPETKETRETHAPEEKREPAPRTPGEILESMGMHELLEIPEGPWAYPRDYNGFYVPLAAAKLGWKYAVRSKSFGRDLVHEGTPVGTWPITSENPNPRSVHALVQAVIDFRGYDQWQHIDTPSDAMDLPSYGDDGFREVYRSRLAELPLDI